MKSNKVVFISCLLIILITSTALAAPFEILSQSYHFDGFAYDSVMDLTQNTPTGYIEVWGGTAPPLFMNHFVYGGTSGGILDPTTLIVSSSLAAENAQGNASATLTFRPNYSFIMDFTFNAWTSTGPPPISLAIASTDFFSVSAVPEGVICLSNGECIFGDTYTMRVRLVPSQTYTISAYSHLDVGSIEYARAFVTGTVVHVPEPGMLFLFGGGIVGLIAGRKVLGKRDK